MKDDRESRVENRGLSRRQFIGVSCTALSGSVVAGVAPSLAAAALQGDARDQYPIIDVTSLDALRDDVPIYFSYPDSSAPATLLRLRQSAPGGVGPDNRIVAYSMLCTHKGCPVAYRPERKLFICPCHWSSFDPTKNGQMVIGQGSQALPQITLQLRGKVIQAIGVNGLIYGRETNIL
jgi:arsenite oxidase small subunit